MCADLATADIWATRIDALFGREGAFSDDANDRGGATAWGITEAVARAFGYTGPMRDLTRERAASIYRIRYVMAPRLDRVEAIDSALAGRLFDIGVNCGPATGIRFLQRALNVLNRGGALFPDLTVDGAVGAITLAALRAFIAARGDDGRRVLLGMVTAQQSCRYIEIAEHDSSQEDFEFGWQCIARSARSAEPPPAGLPAHPMETSMTDLIARFGEGSTYAALAALLAGLGLHLDPGIVQDLTLAGTGIAGLLGILLRDTGAVA